MPKKSKQHSQSCRYSEQLHPGAMTKFVKLERSKMIFGVFLDEEASNRIYQNAVFSTNIGRGAQHNLTGNAESNDPNIGKITEQSFQIGRRELLLVDVDTIVIYKKSLDAVLRTIFKCNF